MKVVRRALASVATLGFMLATAICAQTPPLPPSAGVHWRNVSIDDYRLHLKSLSTLVETCEAARNIKGCDPAQVGADDRVTIVRNSHSEQRLIRYGWLRLVLSKAEDPDPPIVKPVTSPKPGATPARVQSTTPQLLKAAKTRLEGDLAESGASTSPSSHAPQRAVMQQVLAGAEFRDLQQPSVRDSVFEKFGNWLNQIFESAANFKARSAWIGRALVWGFILGVCVALVYSLLRLERRWRVRLTPEGDDRPAPGAASARDWQLWLEDARSAAASGLWREAIHFVYWASISRLESRRLWPADRARTPREYLALVAPEDPRKVGLSQLTNSFERFWYGGRAAAESDYKSAEGLASTLISGGATARAVEIPAASESGAR